MYLSIQNFLINDVLPVDSNHFFNCEQKAKNQFGIYDFMLGTHFNTSFPYKNL